MTRRTIVVLLGLYFILAFAFATFEKVRDQTLDPSDPISIGWLFVRALAYCLLTGTLPSIGWGFGGGFRLRNAFTPMFGWGMVLVSFCVLRVVYPN